VVDSVVGSVCSGSVTTGAGEASTPKTGLDPPTKVSASAQVMNARPSGTLGGIPAPLWEAVEDPCLPSTS